MPAAQTQTDWRDKMTINIRAIADAATMAAEATRLAVAARDYYYSAAKTLEAHGIFSRDLDDLVRGAERACRLALMDLTSAVNSLPPAPAATSRPGDAAAVMHDETGIDYSTCLVVCNID
jgi:hypothetical protein